MEGIFLIDKEKDHGRYFQKEHIPKENYTGQACAKSEIGGQVNDEKGRCSAESQGSRQTNSQTGHEEIGGREACRQKTGR